jgi:hypothetical protein
MEWRPVRTGVTPPQIICWLPVGRNYLQIVIAFLPNVPAAVPSPFPRVVLCGVDKVEYAVEIACKAGIADGSGHPELITDVLQTPLNSVCSYGAGCYPAYYISRTVR